MKRWLIALTVSLGLLAPAAAFWQSRDSNYNVAISAGASYQGPGDIVSGATFWGSCARVYEASLASTFTSLCDLVSSSAPTTVLCTLRGSATGLVDLSAYCTGAVTPAALCALQTGGVCNVAKVYDQTGNGNHLLQTTAATQPILTFSGANGLPGMTGTSAAATVILSAGNITQALPFSMSAVLDRTGSVTTTAIAVGQRNAAVGIGGGSNANNLAINLGSGSFTNIGGNDNSYHCVNTTLVSGAGSIANIDGTDSGSLNAGTAGFTGNPFSFFRSSGASFQGVIMEGGFWPTSSFTSGNRSSVYSNQHSSSTGYNGAC
jgi:hypothetical protein